MLTSPWALVPLLLITSAAFSSPVSPQTPSKDKGAAALPVFAEQYRYQVTENVNRVWDFKSLSDRPQTIKGTISKSGVFAWSFQAGTLLVIGDTGITLDAAFDRAEYRIKCTYRIQKDTIIEVHTEGDLAPNLGFVRDGRVVTDFTVMDTSGKIVASNKRTIDVRNGKVQKVYFENSPKPKVLKSQAAGLVDLEAMTFDVRPLKQPHSH